RDLWQSRLLVLHLGLHAIVAGLAILLLLAPSFGAAAYATSRSMVPVMIVALLAGIALALLDAFGRHPTPNAAAAARALTKGPQAGMFWMSLGLGAALPALVVAVNPGQWGLAASALVLAGLLAYGHALVLAGQGPPIS